MFDHIVIGQGLSGFAAAITLKKKGAKVAVVANGTGSTSVSSGLWDFGLIPSSTAPMSELQKSWKNFYRNILVGNSGSSTDTLLQDAKEIANALSPLEFTTALEKPLLLPTTSGVWRPTL